MVHTRSGKDAHSSSAASYDHSSERNESTRHQQRKKRRRNVARRAPIRTRTRSGASIQMMMPESEETDDAISSATTVLTTTSSTRVLRGSTILRRKPRCSDFGKTRHFAFHGQGFMFCGPCDLWDSLPPDASKRNSINSRRFGCKAGHLYFSHPTTLKMEGCFEQRKRQQTATAAPIVRQLLMDDEDDDSVISQSSSERSSTSSSSSKSSTNTSGATGGATAAPCIGGADETSVTERSSTTINAWSYAEQADYQQEQSEMALRLQVETLNGKIVLMRQKIHHILTENRALRRQAQTAAGRGGHQAALSATAAGGNSKRCVQRSRNKAFTIDLLDVVSDVTRATQYRRWSDARVGHLVAKAMWSQEKFVPHLVGFARKHFRHNVFTSFNILREMDLAGGTLSYEGMDILRRVETCGVKCFRGSMIPSKSELKRTAGAIEWFGMEYCPFRSQQTVSGESIQFDYTKAMLCVSKAFHLDEIGKERGLSVASSIDGASLSKNLSIIAGGIKVTDRSARCPTTNRPLLDNPFTMTAQSRNLCVPFKIMMGRETKQTFKEFASLFQFLDDLSSAATIPVAMEGYHPFSVMTNCDLSAQWKGLCKGGAAKVHTLPCTGCATESEALATPNSRPCNRWCMDHSASDPHWMCFHKDMASPERINTIKGEVEELISTLERALVEILAESKMTRFDVELDPTTETLNDVTSIHCSPQTVSQQQSLSRLFTNELILRGLDIDGSLETRRERLRHALKGEATIERLSKEIAHGEVKEGAYFLLMSTLPCVLHMENRNGIKILSMLLVEGLSNAKKQLLYTDVNAEGARVTQFITNVELLVNQSMLGTPNDPCQWMCPFDFNKKEMGPITMDNVRTRRVIDALDILVDECVMDVERKRLWMIALDNYRISMVLLRKKDDFTNVMVATYQCHADKFYQAWIHLWQKEGITNYLHMIGSGHVAEYLFKWKNLYRFSQQGWEAMNSLIKTYFFRRTSHGGGVRGASQKSRLIPIARWLQRRMIFLCRIEESAIRKYLEDHPIPDAFRSQALSQDDVYESTIAV